MRKIVYGGACSLDGYVARRDGAIDWIVWSDEAGQIAADGWKRFDTVVMGRKTFEAALRLGQDPAMQGMATYVASRTLRASDHESVSVLGVDLANHIRTIKRAPGKDICLMGGGELASSLFDEGLIDTVELNMHPLLLGSGIPMFPAAFREQRLTLRETRPLENGCLFLAYELRVAR
jgi:dihydrofolate reductase